MATRTPNTRKNGSFLSSSKEKTSNVSIWVLILCNLLVFQVTYTWTIGGPNKNNGAAPNVIDNRQQLDKIMMGGIPLSSKTTASSTTTQQAATATVSTSTRTLQEAKAAVAQLTAVSSLSSSVSSPLAIPEGEAVALPSVRELSEDDKKVERKIYGGEGDKKHLGGFTDIDLHGISPATWKLMIEYFGVKSLLDVGCGRGISTSWFALHGVETLCVEGSHDAVEKTMVPNADQVVTEHDFSRGPWWPSRTVDAVWCVEFLEHVGRNFQQNYIPAFRKAAFIFATSSQWGGWHHVEVHPNEWWVAKMQSYGFVYSEYLTQMVRNIAATERGNLRESPKKGETYNAQHVYMTMKVFINPAVASLPEHQHLFAQDGCFKHRKNSVISNKPCGEGRGGNGETVMDPAYSAIKLTPEMDEAWVELVKKNIKNDK